MRIRSTARFGILLLLMGLLLAACQPITLPEKNSVTPARNDGGRLAYIGGDGNVYVISADLTQKVAITDDATTTSEGSGRSYHRVAWAPDGELAFAAVERGMGVTQGELYVAQPGEAAQLVGSSVDNFVIYLYWSPVPCPEQPDCQRLAYLIGNNTDITLRLVELAGDRVTNTEIGAGRPFYFSWAANGAHLLWHRGGSGRGDPLAQISRFDITEQTVHATNAAPGYFVAPAWSPVAEQWLDVIDGQDAVILRQVDAQTEAATEILQAANEISFVWSPDGSQVAYAARARGDDPFFGPIHVYDLATGASRRITDLDLHVQAFFWSPDGARIGYLNWLALPNEAWAQWRVYDLATNQDRGFSAFLPSFPMRMMIGSFNQYAQSDRFWSPDGRYLTYADRDRALVERVWLVDTQAPRGADPILVDEGVIGVWSWE